MAAIIRELDQQPEQTAAWLERMHALVVDAEDADLVKDMAGHVRAGRWKERT